MRLGTGSSPRVRGKRRRPRGGDLARRLIPARAGKTRTGRAPARASRAHPRACGENPRAHRTRPGGHGSSPRVRGKLQTSFSLIIGVRLIPARAGKTRESKAVPAGYWAHPRACGENIDCAYYPHGETGSSPRVRGKRGRCRRRPLHRGLIPARAGKTRAGASTIRRRRAHPRACGENAGNSYEEMSMMGSSPRVRGKQPQRRPTPSPPRLIPARAGKTNTTAFPLEWDRAHPRACGENRTAGKSLSNRAGSSPRVRGKLGGIPLTCYRIGLIPARAGKTGSFVAVSITPKAHPRACGENPRRTVTLSAIRGSSPRVRGKHKDRKTGKPTIGLIPARAGKTTPPGSW